MVPSSGATVGTGPLRAVGAVDAPSAVRMVTTPAGTPHAIVSGGRRRLVIAIRDDWLVQDRWWTDTPVDRHYHELVVEPGRLMTVYRDARTGTWFAHF